MAHLEQPGDEAIPSILAPLGCLLGQIRLLFAIDDILARKEVRSKRSFAGLLVDQLVSGDHAQVQWNTQVPGDEVAIIETLETWIPRFRVDEDIKVLEYRNQDAKAEGEVSAVDAERSNISHLVIRNTLSCAGFQEVDMCHEDGNPYKQAEDGDEVDKVTKYSGRFRTNVEEGNQRDQGGKT